MQQSGVGAGVGAGVGVPVARSQQSMVGDTVGNGVGIGVGVWVPHGWWSHMQASWLFSIVQSYQLLYCAQAMNGVPGLRLPDGCWRGALFGSQGGWGGTGEARELQME